MRLAAVIADTAHALRSNAGLSLELSMACNTVVIVSNHAEMRVSLEALVRGAGLEVESANSLKLWLESDAQPVPACCVLLDVAEGDLVASDQIAMFAGVCSTHRVLVLVSSADVATAVQAIRHGAAEVIQKPFEHCSILERIKQLVSTTS